MSVQAITWSLGRAASVASQATLFVLANYADEWGVTYVGQDKLAADCSCRKATISENLKRLEDAGLIGRVQRRDAKGRRTSDHVVLAPLASDRGAMADADKRAREKHPAEVCDLARQDTVGVSGRPDTLDGASGYASRADLDTAGVPEPSVEPSVNGQHHHPQQGARATWPGVAEQMQSDGEEFLRQKRKVSGRIVTAREMALAAAALSEFNRQLEGKFELGPWLSLIVARVRDHPSWDAAAHARLVQSAFRLKWWERRGEKRRAKPPVIWSERSFPNVVDDATREAEARREMQADRRLRDKVFDGRPWDELTKGEQENLKANVAMDSRPWAREDPVPVASNGNGNGHAPGFTAENWLDPEFD